MLSWVKLLAAAEPLVVSLIADIAALRKKYPQLTDAQVQDILNVMSTDIQAITASTKAEILADREAHKNDPIV